MGLFDFIKDVGAKILGVGQEEKQIKEYLEKELGTAITNLEVDFKNGEVTLKGMCDTQATREKAVLLAGNIQGVSKVNDQLSSPIAPPKEETTFYTIKKGDTLSKIAKAYYGNAMKYPVIFEANREVIKNPDLIYPGQVIRIPKVV
jgi:nucleoid-associated protein YgaU